jgi:hypothetical protein
MQTTVRLLAPQLEAEAGSIRLELSPSLPPVLADSNQILHVCIHLAGQIRACLNRETTPPSSLARTARGELVLVDFSSCEPGSLPLSFSSPLTPKARTSRLRFR